MKIKIMYPNSRGNLEFTKEEFEKLLNEAYDEGYSDGKRNQNNFGYTLSTPTYYSSNTTANSYTVSASNSVTPCENGISIADVCSVKGEIANEV